VSKELVLLEAEFHSQSLALHEEENTKCSRMFTSRLSCPSKLSMDIYSQKSS